MKKCVALIPARGGSKRLPRKNILDLHGKPLLAYTIEAALAAERFSEVVVSTEDDEIADIALQFGATVDRRTLELAGDEAKVIDVCMDFLNNRAIDTLAVLYATAPLRDVSDIRAVVDLLSEDCRFSMAATVCEWPVHQTLRYQNGDVQPLFPDWINRRADKLDQFCVDNGSTYAVEVETFLQQKTFYGDSLKVHLMPSRRSIDVDTSEDYRRLLYEYEAEIV